MKFECAILNFCIKLSLSRTNFIGDSVMEYISRDIEDSICKTLARGKSVLLLGPRQTGKTTIVNHLDKIDMELNFALTDIRLRYEEQSSVLVGEVEGCKQKLPLVFIDEVQKVPEILDNVQYLIDNEKAQFVLTGSSVRKLRRSGVMNLLPGRVVLHHLDPLMMSEYKNLNVSIEDLIFYGSLPEILLTSYVKDKEIDLKTYVGTYLDEEIRAEAAVRNLSKFSRFLALAAIESGNIVNLSKVSQEIGVAHTTIADYYQILEDCMIAERIEPYLKTKTRRLLVRSSKYILFDLGVRRIGAKEGDQVSDKRKGQLFEQFIGLELIRYIRARSLLATVHFWRSLSGAEVDWVVYYEGRLIPIEVKWTKNPKKSDIKYLSTFVAEYPEVTTAYVVCQTPRRIKLAENIIALPWQELAAVFDD
jgi:predicted AAA+ superfamily ATPase